MAIDITKVMQATETIAEQLGIDLTAYGNASPTKLILTVLQTSVQIIQETTQIALTEQNPLTATELKSRMGLAALVSLNPAQLFRASIGKVVIKTNDNTVTIGQHAKLLSYDNIEYYVVLPAETVQFASDTNIVVKQGVLKQQNFTVTGEAWESFALYANNYVDCSSIEVYANNTRLSVGFKLDENADCYVRPNYAGDIEVIISPNANLSSGESITVIYGDCLGIDGDNMQVNQYMIAKEFAYSGTNDISDKIQVLISEPIIGGADFANYDTELSNAIMLNGHNNLIGNEPQLLQYVKQFKQYSIHSAKLSNGVFAIKALRNLQMLVKNQDYWTACQNVELRTEDILALNSHLNQHAKKSLDLLVSVEHALQEQCKVNVTINMSNASLPAIEHVVVLYLLSKQSANAYDTATLYKTLIAMQDVKECAVSFSGNTNEFGTAIPMVSEHALICSAATITINGISTSFGNYEDANNITINKVISDTSIERITNINSVLS